MRASVLIVRGAEKFVVSGPHILECFNGQFRVKFTDVICPNCGFSATPWIPVEKVAPTADGKRNVEIAQLKARLDAVFKHLEKYRGTKEPDYCCADCIEDIAKEVGFSFDNGVGGVK